MSERYFRTKHERAYSDVKKIQASLPQDSLLDSILYLLYTGDLPTFIKNVVATLADDATSLVMSDNFKSTKKSIELLTKKNAKEQNGVSN